MYKCRECKKNTLKIVGTGSYDDTIEVACDNAKCLAEYDVEPDGLGQGGMEFADAQMIEIDRQ